jgi:phosphatidylglycerophosphate synthase
MTAATPRRELATRDASWARRLAWTLGRAGARPNAVSLFSIVCACGGFAAFALVPGAPARARAALFVAAAASIQLRLLCNLLDGMLAVEEGFHTRTGALYNEIPDRVADVVLLLGAGCAVRDLAAGLLLGVAAAMLAVFTAYIRVLGGSLGTRQYFSGPMAKQHRMFALTCAAIASAVAAVSGAQAQPMVAALAVIVVGTAVTARRRVASIARELEQR